MGQERGQSPIVRLSPEDVRQLKLFAWFLLITNGLIVGIGLLLGRALEERPGALILILAVAALVNGCFLLIVVGNLVALILGQIGRGLRRRRPRRGPRGDEDRGGPTSSIR